MLAEQTTATAPALDFDALIKGIAIPPRPALLAEVQAEIDADDPDFGRIAHLIGRDVALTAGVLRSVNSPFYALSRKAGSLSDAIALLACARSARWRPASRCVRRCRATARS